MNSQFLSALVRKNKKYKNTIEEIREIVNSALEENNAENNKFLLLILKKREAER